MLLARSKSQLDSLILFEQIFSDEMDIELGMEKCVVLVMYLTKHVKWLAMEKHIAVIRAPTQIAELVHRVNRWW